MIFALSLAEKADFSSRVQSIGPIARCLLALLLFCLAGIASGAADQPPLSRVVPHNVGKPAPLLENIRKPPLGLPAMDTPVRNPPTARKIALGRKLFFDRRLSVNGSLSCGMCHVPEQGFTQREVRTPVGVEGRFVKRNAPALYNVGYRRVLFHDGREYSLANQVWQPLLLHNEMANPSIGAVLTSIVNAEDYNGLFEEAFEQGLTVETLGMALASYQRGLVSGNSPFDRWYFGKEESLSPEAKGGWQVFRDAGCVSCHTVEQDHAHFSNDKFYDTGVGYARSMGIGADREPVRLAPGVSVVPTVSFETAAANDLGRYEATGRSGDRWLFRVPSLRNVALTKPYMHDGSFPDLSSVVSWYNRGGVPHPGLDPRIRPLNLSEVQVAELLAFLESLTGDNVAALEADGRSVGIGDP